jgi:hypothetical protein
MNHETPNACPHCGAEQKFPFAEENAGIHSRKFSCGFMEDSWFFYRPDLCREREARQKAEAERDEARKDLIKNLQTTGGMPWREWREECVKETLRADENLERAEKAEADVKRLKKLCEMALESAEDAVEERDIKRRIADDICSLRKDLNK